MKSLWALFRGCMLSSLMAGAVLAPLPALGAPQGVALLSSYLGDWRGSGVMTGTYRHPVDCKLTLREGNAGKINYSGRCSVAGGVLSVNGTLAYIEALQRYEAAMTSNVAFSGIAVGEKRGNGVTFDLRERDQSEGEDVTITARIVLDDGNIAVDFRAIYEQSGDLLAASVPFSR